MKTGFVHYVTTGPVGIMGDYNNSGQVEQGDLDLVLLNWGQPGVPVGWTNDLPLGNIDQAELDGVLLNWGNTAAASFAAAVPEPAAWWLASACGVLLCGWGARRRLAAVAVVAALSPTLADAAYPDRIYRFGDIHAFTNIEGAMYQSFEDGAAGQPAGSGLGSDNPGHVLDSEGNLDFLTSFSDLLPSGGPTYVNTSATGRPGAASGELGIQFVGIDDRLAGLGLGFPANGDDPFQDDRSYGGLLSRAVGGWVRPTGGQGVRQDVVNDIYQFGVHITPENTWGMNFGSDLAVVNTYDFDSGIPVALNEWVHVQQRTIGNNFAVLYVNGVVELVTPLNDPQYHGVENLNPMLDPTDPNLQIVFGSNLEGSGNFFTGQLDDFELHVIGNNSTTANGHDYGAFNLVTDNGFVAAIDATLVPGDANGDGVVNGNGLGAPAADDVAFFVDHFIDVQSYNGTVIGDLNSRLNQADFNYDGRTDLADWYILRENHVDAAAAANLDLGELLAGTGAPGVPEPSAAVLLAAMAITAVLCRGRLALIVGGMSSARAQG